MTPWGFKDSGRGRGMVATTSVQERNDRMELGETALMLVAQLGITAPQLEAMRVELDKYCAAVDAAAERDASEEVKVPLPDLVATLERLQRV